MDPNNEIQANKQAYDFVRDKSARHIHAWIVTEWINHYDGTVDASEQLELVRRGVPYSHSTAKKLTCATCLEEKQL